MTNYPETPLIEAWAKCQKRATNRGIRRAFELDEDAASVVYGYLRTAGIIGRMGYVKEDE